MKSIFVLMFALGIHAHAEFDFSLNMKGLSPQSAAAIQLWLSETKEKLPPQMKKRLGRTIKVEFQNWGDGEITPNCHPSKGEKAVGLGKTSGFSGDKISLNQKFVSIVVGGESQSVRFDCGHKNTYQLATATLIHELGHLYDLHDRQSSGRALISSDSHFRDLMNFRTQWNMWGPLPIRSNQPENKMESRSPDPYEDKNLKEAFAVNLEYFLLDPEFQCRRPTVHKYYERHFGWAKPSLCQKNYEVYVSSANSSRPRLVKFDPSRLYAIHYLWAGKGEQMMSRWGHAMFRLVFCSPERATPGPECLADQEEHIVVSYRAHITNFSINSVAGMFGKYPSQLFLQTLSDVRVEYNKGELREITSYPLNLSEQEKVDFIHRVLEQYWSYRGSYYFITNNCASESLSLVRSTLGDENLARKSGINPIRVRKSLEEVGRLDSTLLKDKLEAKLQGYYFESYAETLKRVYQVLLNSQIRLGWPTWREFLDNTTTQQRAQIISTVDLHLSNRSQVLSSLYLFESQLETMKGIALGKKMAEKLSAQPESDEALLAKKILNAPLTGVYLKSGYGIPQESDLSEDTSSNSLQERAVYEKEIKKWVREHFKTEVQEILEIQTNKENLAKEIASVAQQKRLEKAKE